MQEVPLASEDARTEKLRAIYDATLGLTSELALERLLEKAIKACAELVSARYGALAIFDKDDVIETFIVTGITTQQRRAIGDLPRGHGLLGLMTHQDEPIRVPIIADHPASSGFPPNHPPMTSFLGVPIRSQRELLGVVYLTDRIGADEFTNEDAMWLDIFANHIAITIENARLYGQLRDFAISEERERLGRDLHDGALQSIYGVGLRVEDCIDRLRHNDAAIGPDLEQVVEDLNKIIRDLRSTIFQLRPNQTRTASPDQRLEGLVREMSAQLLIKVNLKLEGDRSFLTRGLVDDLVFVVREALTNAYRHGRASSALVHMQCGPEIVRLQIVDDGTGLPVGANPARDAGYGLTNMRYRVERHGGVFDVQNTTPRGLRVDVSIPLSGEQP